MLNIKKISAWNGSLISNETLKNINVSKDKTESMFDIFKYEKFMKIFVLTNILWFCQNIANTGAKAFAAMSTDNPYMMMTIHSVIDMIASISANYVVKYFGCKKGTVISYFSSGALYILAAIADQDNQIISFMIAMITARYMLTIGYNVQYLYAAEIYPTSIRSSAYAVRVAVGSLGNLIAPQVCTYSYMFATFHGCINIGHTFEWSS